MKGRREKVYLYIAKNKRGMENGGLMIDRRKKVYLYGVVPYNYEVGFIPVYTAKNKRPLGNVQVVCFGKEAKRLPSACLFLCDTETTQSALELRNRRFFK